MVSKNSHTSASDTIQRRKNVNPFLNVNFAKKMNAKKKNHTYHMHVQLRLSRQDSWEGRHKPESRKYKCRH
jgi:hypothetical protein